MHGKVEVWYMTDEQRLAYIAKYPIQPTKKPKGAGYSTDTIDYKQVVERKKAKKR